MARKTNTTIDSSLLEAALEGLLLQKARIEEQITQVRGRLGQRTPRADRPAKPAAAAPRKRQLSPAARKRIAAAQKRRWAEYRKNTEQAG